MPRKRVVAAQPEAAEADEMETSVENTSKKPKNEVVHDEKCSYNRCSACRPLQRLSIGHVRVHTGRHSNESRCSSTGRRQRQPRSQRVPLCRASRAQGGRYCARVYARSLFCSDLRCCCALLLRIIELRLLRLFCQQHASIKLLVCFQCRLQLQRDLLVLLPQP